ncbi:MAG: VOC family protein [Chloroflexi bacterium]|nr:VOC family protein [Chloroflexota bacterium]
MAVARLNHAVLYVRDLDRSVEFYRQAFGFTEVIRMPGFAAFLRAEGGDNHHDLGLFTVGAEAPSPPRGSTGLYHLAWQVEHIEDLRDIATTLTDLGALTGTSDHGATKSLYGKDPDGNEFEVMWLLPREAWGRFEDDAVVLPLNLDREIRKWGTRAEARS